MARLHIFDLKEVLEETPKIILAQAIPRLNRLDFILEKGTELGMSEIWLYASEYGERKEFTEHQLERMRGVTIAAMKQCGRLHLPKIVMMPLLSKWAAPRTDYALFFGDVSSTAKYFMPSDLPNKSTTGLVFFIGPESGFSEKETILLKEFGSKGVKLHPNILRTDTAALTALSVLHLYATTSIVNK